MMSRTCMSRDRQHALEHDQRIAVEQAALARLAQILDELGEIARLAGHRLRDALQPAAGVASGLFGHGRSGYSIRHTGSKTQADQGFESPRRSIFRASAAALMVEAQQVQHAVHHQVRPVRLAASCPARAPLARRPARRSRARPRYVRPSGLGPAAAEGQHVGRPVLAAVARVQGAAARRRRPRCVTASSRRRRWAPSAAPAAAPPPPRPRIARAAAPRPPRCIAHVDARARRGTGSRPSTCAVVRRDSLRRLARCAAPADGAPRRAS